MLCAIAKIDPTARERLEALCGIAEEFGYAPRPLHGHLTLVTYLGEDEADFIGCCKASLENQRCITRLNCCSLRPALWLLPNR